MTNTGRSPWRSPGTDDTATSTGQHYATIDGLRGFAILSVMCFHFIAGYKGQDTPLRLISGAADFGWMGVDLFFVLSGFLITGILYDTSHRPHRIRNFYARRALRIFPLFYTVLFLLLLLTPFLHLSWHPAHALYFLYLSNLPGSITGAIRPLHPWINLGHFWSLAVEEQFYLLWPFVIWTNRDRRRLITVTLIVLVLCPVLRATLILTGSAPETIGKLLFTRADSLLAGGLVALLLRGPVRQHWPLNRALAATMLALACILWLSHGANIQSPWMNIAGYSLLALVFACLTMKAALGDAHVDAIFNNRFWRFWGKYSYGLYIFHGIYFVALRESAKPMERYIHSGAVTYALIVICGFGFSIALALLSYHFLEAPILKHKARFA